VTDGTERLAQLLDELPAELVAKVFTHSSWTEQRSDSYERLAFLGDGMLGLVVADVLLKSSPSATAGDLTKIRAQAASRQACARVAARINVGQRLAERAPTSAEIPVEEVIGAQSVLAEVCEAVIGALLEHFGYDQTALAVAEAFAGEIVAAEEHPGDFKSALQELLARRGDKPDYVILGSEGPAHDRRFECAVEIRGDRYGTGTGRSKKEAEQEAAGATLKLLGVSDRKDAEN
jgi:ribonuclease-3